MGGIEEALLYCHQGGLEAWMDAEGALTWNTAALGEMETTAREVTKDALIFFLCVVDKLCCRQRSVRKGVAWIRCGWR